MASIYTKTFGGKIGKNLHSVSPDNIFGKKFKMATLKIFRQKYANTTSCEKSFTNKKRPILSKFKFGWNKYLQNYWISCTKWCVHIIGRATWQKKISFSFTEIFQLLDKISNCFTSKLLFLDMLPLIKDLFKSTIFATQELFSFKKIYPMFETCRFTESEKIQP